jgi:hypothetical protein
MAQRNGTGMFPRARSCRSRSTKGGSGFCQTLSPLLPLEEGRLNDMPLRENFVERVLAAQFCYGKRHDRMDPNAR